MLFYAPRATDMSKTLTEFGEAVDVLSNVFAGIYFVEFVIKVSVRVRVKVRVRV